MVGHPKYEFGDKVKFNCGEKEKIGVIVIIDTYGTFEDNSDVSYDILAPEDNCLYKHFREDTIIEKLEHLSIEEMNKIW